MEGMMNAARRKAIADLANAVGEVFTNVEGLLGAAQTLLDEEREAFDNMPESFQNGERGTVCLAAIDNLESAVEALDAIMQSAEECTAALNEAAA
jgi:hypothetical protein